MFRRITGGQVGIVSKAYIADATPAAVCTHTVSLLLPLRNQARSSQDDTESTLAIHRNHRAVPQRCVRQLLVVPMAGG